MNNDDFFAGYEDAHAAPQRPTGDNSGDFPPNLDWSPLKGGGTNFRTHKLIEKSSQRLEFKASTGGILFGAVFTVPGIFLFFLAFAGIDFGEEKLLGTIIMASMGVLFGGVGILLLVLFGKPVVFDKSIGLYWKGKRPANPAHAKPGKWTRLSNIIGIQLLSEYVSGSESSYHSYELNLVLEDGSRLNVVDHGKSDALAKDAQKLAHFLNVPVWDKR